MTSNNLWLWISRVEMLGSTWQRNPEDIVNKAAELAGIDETINVELLIGPSEISCILNTGNDGSPCENDTVVLFVEINRYEYLKDILSQYTRLTNTVNLIIVQLGATLDPDWAAQYQEYAKSHHHPILPFKLFSIDKISDPIALINVLTIAGWFCTDLNEFRWANDTGNEVSETNGSIKDMCRLLCFGDSHITEQSLIKPKKLVTGEINLDSLAKGIYELPDVLYPDIIACLGDIGDGGFNVIKDRRKKTSIETFFQQIQNAYTRHEGIDSALVLGVFGDHDLLRVTHSVSAAGKRQYCFRTDELEKCLEEWDWMGFISGYSKPPGRKLTVDIRNNIQARFRECRGKTKYIANDEIKQEISTVGLVSVRYTCKSSNFRVYLNLAPSLCPWLPFYRQGDLRGGSETPGAGIKLAQALSGNMLSRAIESNLTMTFLHHARIPGGLKEYFCQIPASWDGNCRPVNPYKGVNTGNDMRLRNNRQDKIDRQIFVHGHLHLFHASPSPENQSISIGIPALGGDTLDNDGCGFAIIDIYSLGQRKYVMIVTKHLVIDQPEHCLWSMLLPSKGMVIVFDVDSDGFINNIEKEGYLFDTEQVVNVKRTRERVLCKAKKLDFSNIDTDN